MPLSDHEQRLLEQLERALQDEDPKFASALQGSRLRGRLRLRLLLACLGVLLGLAAQEWTLFVQGLPMGGGLRAMLTVLPLLAVGSGCAAWLADHPELG